MAEQALSARSQEKRERIREAAQRLFLLHGVAATSMDSITAEAGVSKQTVYAYFPGKESLLAEVLETLVGRRAHLWQEWQSHAGPVVDRAGLARELNELAAKVVGTLLQPEYLGTVRVIISECVREPGLGELFRQSVAAPVLDAVADTPDRAVEGGALQHPPPGAQGRGVVIGGHAGFACEELRLAARRLRRV